MQNILLIRIDRLGDLVLTLPAIYSVHKNFPNANIDLLVNEAFVGLVENIPFVRKIYCTNPFKFRISKFLKLMFNLRNNGYDLAVDLAPCTNHLSSIILFFAKAGQKAGYAVGLRKFFTSLKVPPPKEMKSETEMVLDVLRIIGLKDLCDEIIIPTEKKAEASVASFIKQNNFSSDELLVGISPGASSDWKMWPKDKFAELMKKLNSAFHCKVLLLGSKNEKNLCDEINALAGFCAINCAGIFDIKQLCACIKMLDLFVGNNSGSMHIAYAFNTPAIIINGPSSISRWGHRRDDFVILSKNKLDFEARYDKTSGINSISVDDVFREVKQFL